MSIDFLLLTKISALSSRFFWFDVLVIFFAQYLPYVLMAVLFLFLLKNYKKYRQMVLATCLSAGLASIITLVIRFFYYRPRPFVLENITALFSHSASSSFPSLHAASFFSGQFFNCSLSGYSRPALAC